VRGEYDNWATKETLADLINNHYTSFIKKKAADERLKKRLLSQINIQSSSRIQIIDRPKLKHKKNQDVVFQSKKMKWVDDIMKKTKQKWRTSNLFMSKESYNPGKTEERYQRKTDQNCSPNVFLPIVPLKCSSSKKEHKSHCISRSSHRDSIQPQGREGLLLDQANDYSFYKQSQIEEKISKLTP